jgi:cell division protein YceG involved in septum cleavage
MADKTVNFLMYIAGMAFNLVIMAVVGLLVIAGFTWGFDFGSEFAGVMVAEGDNYEIEFHIAQDASTSEIARRLEVMEIIPNRFLFQLELFLRGISSDYTAGTYTLNLFPRVGQSATWRNTLKSADFLPQRNSFTLRKRGIGPSHF